MLNKDMFLAMRLLLFGESKGCSVTSVARYCSCISTQFSGYIISLEKLISMMPSLEISTLRKTGLGDVNKSARFVRTTGGAGFGFGGSGGGGGTNMKGVSTGGFGFSLTSSVLASGSVSSCSIKSNSIGIEVFRPESVKAPIKN